MSNPKTPLKVQFIQACVPVLEDGDYRFTVSQTVTGVTDDSDLPSVTKQVSVAGPRFSLDPSLIYGEFPPKNSQGHYDSSLPHVVISRKTLPWERTIDDQVPAPYNPDDPSTVPTPWLALLSFSDEESSKISKLTPVQLSQLNSPASGIFFPQLTLDSFEKTTDYCQVINVDIDLFTTVAPKLTDLPYLVHARYSDNTNKATTNSSSDGYYSVVIGNRFPLSSKTGTKNTMYLVSLEGYQDHLPGGTGSLSTYEQVQLVVLYSWSYTDQTDPYDFSTLARDLDIQPLSLPYEDVSQAQVKSAFELGYTALNHMNRVGEKSISWYRGPCLPQQTANELEGIVYPNSDAPLRYDPVTGMFDVSYAAAWQLGQLLAIQNKGFATALFQERVNERRNAIQEVNNDLLKRNAPGLSKTDNSPDKGPKTTQVLSLLKQGLASKILATGKGDASGLRKAAGKVPGILSKSRIDEAVKNSTDPTSAITAQLQSSNKNTKSS